MNPVPSPQDRNPSLPYARRYVSGKVIQVEVDVLHFQLDPQNYDLPAPQVPERARVRKDDWPEGTLAGNYSKGSRYRLFLIQPTHEDGHLWHASLRWGEESANPWNSDSQNCPLRGELVTGTVSRYLGDYGAVVRLDDSGIEAFLHIKETPDRAINPKERALIQRSLHVGDRIRAEIMVEGTDPDRLTVWLSVNGAMERARSEFFARYDDAQRPQDVAKEAGVIAGIKATETETALPFSGQRLLVVEHDAAYAKQLVDLLEGMGAEVEQSSNLKHVETLLRGPANFSHILSDYQMGTGVQRHGLFEMLKRSKLPVALMSGDYSDAAQEACVQGWPLLCKPVAYADIHAWLLKGERPPPPGPDNDISSSWELGVEGRATLKRAGSALARFCQETRAIAVCWLRQQREGVFAPLALHGLKEGFPTQVEAQLGTSLVASVIGNRQAIAQTALHAGPLRGLAESLNAASVWGIPVGDPQGSDDALPDALLVFSTEWATRNAVLPSAWREPFRQLEERLSQLGEMTLLAERLREAESFATMGRISGAVLHEIRQALQGLETYLPLAAKHLADGDPGKASKDIRELSMTKERIVRLAKTNLYNLQKARREEVALNERVREILSWFSPAIQRHEWLLTAEISAHPMTVYLPPEVVEQPLANLLDNALHHMGKWGEIVVSVYLVADDLLCPIRIEVRDQGEGMTVEQIDRLFTPRVTSKGVKGYGLGLYTSRQLLRAVGGEVEAVRGECYRWMGSLFRIRLPDKVRPETKVELP